MDPKVHHELGAGGVPEEDCVRMEKLVKDYSERRQRLMELRFNDEVLNLKPKTVAATSSDLTKDEENLVKEIVEKNIISKANCRAVTQAARRDQASRLETNTDANKKRKAKKKLDLALARVAFQRWWVDKRRMVMADSDPDFKTKKDAIAII